MDPSGSKIVNKNIKPLVAQMTVCLAALGIHATIPGNSRENEMQRDEESNRNIFHERI
jgi:hypothetical protein